MRRILITNDDGIRSPGIIRLAEAAREFGRVWVVAPESQRSAASHSITLHSPIDVFPHAFPVEDVKAFSCSGTPGDCVRVGCRYVMEEKPDVVLSGINYGYNVATDIQYSATVGAALEGAFQRCLGIALSEDYSECHEVTDYYLKAVLEELLCEKADPETVINVNFPGCALSECRGILRGRTVSKAIPFDDHYPVTERLSDGGVRLMVDGIPSKSAEEGSDFRAVLDRYVSIGTVRNIS